MTNLQIRVIWEGKASSSYNQQMIDRRLEALRDRTDIDAETEKTFLREAKAKLEKSCQPL